MVSTIASHSYWPRETSRLVCYPPLCFPQYRARVFVRRYAVATVEEPPYVAKEAQAFQQTPANILEQKARATDTRPQAERTGRSKVRASKVLLFDELQDYIDNSYLVLVIENPAERPGLLPGSPCYNDVNCGAAARMYVLRVLVSSPPT